MIIETQAWVLHIHPASESSAYVTFFSQQYGLIKCSYRGARKKHNAALQPFTPLWLEAQVYPAGGAFVRKLEMLSPMLTLRKESLFAALYLNELLYLALKPGDPADGLFVRYEETLNILITSDHTLVTQMALRQFEWALAQACGYGITLDRDVSGAALEPHVCYQYIAAEGFHRAAEGLLGADILAMAAGRLNDAAVLKTAKQIMRALVHHLVDGKPIHTRALYTHTT